MIAFKITAVSLLLPAIACIAYALDCPNWEAVSPCMCHNYEEAEASLYCSDDTTTLDQIKNSLTAFSSFNSINVELDGLELGSIPSNFFSGFKIKRLEISYCNLDSLYGEGGKPLEGLEDHLEELIISASFNEFNVPAKLEISHLKKLKRIELSVNKIKDMGNDWFKDAPDSLTTIIINGNEIQALGDKAFADCKNVEELYLGENSIGSVSRSMLPDPAENLQALELDNNGLATIPANLFSNMPKLRILSLTRNKIEQLSKEAFQPIWNGLEEIDLTYNPLQCDSNMDWVSQTPTCASILATCKSPVEKVGKNIPSVRDENCII